MQGQRSAVGSLPETLGFNHGSMSNDAGIDQQICWNNLRNSAQNRLPDYMLPSNGPNSTYLDPVAQERQNLGGWSVGETSSSAAQSQFNQHERKTEPGWSSSMSACSGAALLSEERRYEPSNVLALNNIDVNMSNNQSLNRSPFIQSCSSHTTPQDLNMNSGFEGNDGDCQVLECPNTYRSDGLVKEQMPSSSSVPDQFGLPSGSSGYVMDSDGRPGCSLDGRRMSCKRKAIEGNPGPSSGSGSSSNFEHADASPWHAMSTHPIAATGISISNTMENNLNRSLSEHVNPRLGLSIGGLASENHIALTGPRGAESSRRNFRLRINASQQQNSIPGNVFSAEQDIGNINVPLTGDSSRLPRDALELRPASAAENGSLQGQSVLVHVPSVRRNPLSRWSGAPSLRAGSSSNFSVSGDRDASGYQESNSISMPRNISQHPMFVPASDVGNSTQNPANWSLAGGNIRVAGNVPSTSRSGSNSAFPSSQPSWIPHRNPPHYPRRLSEFVRRSLLSSSGVQSGNHNVNSPAPHSAPASAPEVVLPSGSNNQGHHPTSSRSAMLLERHLDGPFGLPYSLRTLAAAGEGRSRLVSEIRNVLNLMRRGEGLRFEDVMILDQSVFFGMADIHDRHRDMRLDVDNMSYEELLALEERIGNVCTGLSEETILSRLKQRKYACVEAENQAEAEPCCICQEEYNDGEDVGSLECGHDFHRNCIKQWLMHKNLCPICKTTGLSM